MFAKKTTFVRFRQDIKGIDKKVLLKGKKKSNYIYLDNAASTPPLIPVLKEMDDYMDWYAGVHRGTGYKSLISSRIYDDCHEIVGRFVGADLSRDSVVFVKNTTEAVNKLSYRLQLQPQDIIIITAMEHHSNELPWRARAQVKTVPVDNEGKLDLNRLEDLLIRNQPHVKLLAVCGASNVTGHINDVHLMAKIAHNFGCKIFVDGAQLIPHHHFDMKSHDDPEHIDFLAFSGHKIFSPFGVGVLIGPRDVFFNGSPEYQGGGTVKLVFKDEVFWADPPAREEAGSPNIIGAYGLARTLQYLDKLDMNVLSQGEAELTSYTLKKLVELSFVRLYGSRPRVGVISFNLKGIPYALTGAILCFEAGIGLRTGCFCAQNYVRNLLGVPEDYQQLQFYDSKELDKIPGMVRISLAPYNTYAEVDYLIKWLKIIADNRYEFRRRYKFSPQEGGFIPTDLNCHDYISNICRHYMKI
ncbi:MAG: aminotransferase class V-fold PLP-dependent enzyme [Syntrophomonas sp.]|nr:aminotransferase class V-fold PLP-dependent enzyme [Syntrophomonas sp.]